MQITLFENIVNFIKEKFPSKDFIPLHEPIFRGNERQYVNETIDSTFVSSVGSFVSQFEEMMCKITGSKYAVAIVNGTSALHMALLLSNVKKGDEVLTQSLTFIATCNAVSYLGASPIFIDVDIDSLGMSPKSLLNYLKNNAEIRKDGYCYNTLSGKRIKACVPMHTFGLPCRIDELLEICQEWNIKLIEDSAESIGSYYKEKHTGSFGEIGVFSFNGNKTITCGGGGALITNNRDLAIKAKHLTTQAKLPHQWAFIHDEIGYNYRMPNLNAALACAQLEQLFEFVENKRGLAKEYSNFFSSINLKYIDEIDQAKANYWLNAILFRNIEERDDFLKFANNNGVMSRPAWELMHKLPMFENSLRADLSNSEWLSDRLVNIPSSVR
ncbi:LegC family aminotransferase [Aquirufa aurantiipilula]|uniref:LegC family aminotransferase n=1 Tax=Aquirufa aurantiipilula TaxID=2696561 RepID=UPI001CAA6D9F|nr:LegC family aminotransferase [Aquirufa aurantiipilula]MBZ1326605.1 LegC family aminotransferase [Aquirufa aurantiipilula]